MTSDFTDGDKKLIRRGFLKKLGGAVTFATWPGAGLPLAGLFTSPDAAAQGHKHPASPASAGAPRFIPRPQPEREKRPLSTPLRLPGATGLFALIDMDRPLKLTARIGRQPLFPGRSTDLWTYETPVANGNALNPLLRARTGDVVDVTLKNEIGEDTTIHWHGLHVDERNDGSGMHPVKHEQTYVYRYKIANRPGLYWYHPHPHDRTGAQVHQGMGSLLLIEDKAEDALRRELGVDFGVTELPLLLQDKQVDTINKLKYSMGEDDWIGNRVLVNWTPEPCFDARTCLYRLRILNGSNARVYRLAFQFGKQLLPFHLIGVDGGLLAKPHAMTDLYLAPAQRVDLLIDFSKIPLGSSVVMTSLKFDPMENDGGTGVDPMVEHPGAALMGEAFDIMQFNIKESVCVSSRLPKQLAPASAFTYPKPVSAPPRRFRVHIKDRKWFINGVNYHDDMHKIWFTCKAGTSEIWEIRNDMKSMPHPMHVHGFHFRVLERRGSPRQIARLALGPSGVSAHDSGWLDTVLVWPGEVVRIAVDFSPALPGNNIYMFHCHNLEHEDQGLMLNFAVKA
jgi:blue copper oxidase